MIMVITYFGLWAVVGYFFVVFLSLNPCRIFLLFRKYYEIIIIDSKLD